MNLLNSWNHMTPTKKGNNAQLGDTVSFTRKGLDLEGTVIKDRGNTVIVEIQQEAANLLGLENQYTIVNHKNYQIVN